jgi:hypothetical protein
LRVVSSNISQAQKNAGRCLSIARLQNQLASGPRCKLRQGIFLMLSRNESNATFPPSGRNPYRLSGLLKSLNKVQIRFLYDELS